MHGLLKGWDDETTPEHILKRFENYERSNHVYGAGFCGICGNAAGLWAHKKNKEIMCGGCIAYGGSWFVPDNPYEGEDLDCYLIEKKNVKND